MSTRQDWGVRDIPASCTCAWEWRGQLARWMVGKPDPHCVWHNWGAAVPDA